MHMIRSILLILLSTLFVIGCGNEVQLQAPEPPAYVKAVPDNWQKHQLENREAIQTHLEKHEDDYFAFSHFAVSQTDGIPYLILNVLPRLATEFWGEKENFLSAMGLFYDPREAGYPMPSGIGISAFGRKEPLGSIDYASFTYGGCHIGRLKTEEGSFQYLDGGINAEFDVIAYRHKVVQTLNKVYDGETDPVKQQQKVLQAVLKEIKAAQDTDQNYFYKNYRYKEYQFDAEYEKAQIELFRDNAADYVNAFIKQQENVYAGWELLSSTVYKEIEQQTLLGYPGMEDAIAFNAVHTYQSLKEKWYTALFAGLALPKVAAVTDIMAVWEQKTRDPLGWNEDQTLLINGGGQWNGHIPLLFYKNFAAQVTLGFDNSDVRVSAHAERLLSDLPAPAYPFAVDVNLAKRGQTLFAQNCAACHQPNNGKVYRDIGTNMGRALIADKLITLGAQSAFYGSCNPKTEVELSGEKVKPCAEYKGVSLEGKANQTMTKPSQHDGYNALPLIGIWAQAPYLHNGSVPTLYHLLVPNQRPGEFVKSRLDYDQEKIGFNWELPLGEDEGKAYIYQPSASPIIGNQGHDKDITIEGVTYKLNWEDDLDGVNALLEYLKTM